MMNIYSVYDNKSETYANPLFFVNDEVAVRAFYASCNMQDTMLSMFPEDFELKLIGQFDERSGKLLPFSTADNPEWLTVAKATDFVEKYSYTKEEREEAEIEI